MSGPKSHSWISDLDVYAAGKAKVAGATNPVKLSANESALGPSPMAMEAYVDAADKLHRYPDPVYADLRGAIAKKYNIEPDRIVCGVGSDEILKLACRAYLKPGDEVIFPAHSFSMYPIAAKSVGATPVEVDDTGYEIDLENIVSAINDKTKIIFIANPNNPTGTYKSAAEIEHLWRQIPNHILLVLDSAYAEFVDKPDYEDGINLVRKSDNILMTRTFSKLFGLASLRLGWGYASRDIAGVLDKIRDPFNVPSNAQVAGVAALQDIDFQKKAFDHNKKWRKWLSEKLAELSLKVIPSQTNFILFKFENPSKSALDANDFLTKHGYILRYYHNQGLESFLRLTIGTEQENREVINLLKKFLEE